MSCFPYPVGRTAQELIQPIDFRQVSVKGRGQGSYAKQEEAPGFEAVAVLLSLICLGLNDRGLSQSIRDTVDSLPREW